VLVSQKDERRKISKELQDEIVETLTGVGIKTGGKHREHHREKFDIHGIPDPPAMPSVSTLVENNVVIRLSSSLTYGVNTLWPDFCHRRMLA
jgi:signal transduction histidine kinase